MLKFKKYRKKSLVIDAIQITPEIDRTAIMRIGGRIDLNGNIIIPTLEGPHMAREGDWLIKGVEGEYYPCKPSVFAKTYDEVKEDLEDFESNVAEALKSLHRKGSLD